MDLQLTGRPAVVTGALPDTLKRMADASDRTPGQVRGTLVY